MCGCVLEQNNSTENMASYLTSHEWTLSSLCRSPLVKLYTSTEPLLVPEERDSYREEGEREGKGRERARDREIQIQRDRRTERERERENRMSR